jgi:hypothetical protein
VSDGFRISGLAAATAAVIFGGLVGVPAAQAAPASHRSEARQGVFGADAAKSLGALLGVSATSGTNAWAVGNRCVSACGTPAAVANTLILHWNGHRWSHVASPDPSASADYLAGVSATSAANGWAVGDDCVSACGTSGQIFRTLILHWNGHRWSHVASPDPSASANYLRSVSATSAANAWAVGQYCASGCGTEGPVIRALILHWNGHRWSRVASPAPSAISNALKIVTAASARDAWAAGDYVRGGVWKTLILRWNGHRWSRVASPSPDSAFNLLGGVSAASSSRAWAVGTDCTTAQCGRVVQHTLILHWNGHRWTRVTSPNPGPNVNSLFGVSATSATNVWAVGELCDNFSCSSSTTLVLHWNGHRWSQS